MNGPLETLEYLGPGGHSDRRVVYFRIGKKTGPGEHQSLLGPLYVVRVTMGTGPIWSSRILLALLVLIITVFY